MFAGSFFNILSIWTFLFLWVIVKEDILYCHNRQCYINSNINMCSIELKWDGKKLKYDMITRWEEYDQQYEMDEIYRA